jgi:CBS domain containing-hemolysin-like protein
MKVLHALSLGALGICVKDLINQLLRQATILLIEWSLSAFSIVDYHVVSDQPLSIVLSLMSLSQAMGQLRQARHRLHSLRDLSF